MATLVFDIETVARPLSDFDELTKHKIVGEKHSDESVEEYAERAEKRVQDLSFSPMTAQIVAIACVIAETGKGGTYFQAPGQTIDDTDANGFKVTAMTEKEILQKFWEIAEKCDTFVTFNGRTFDAPFLMLRSALHGIRPTKNITRARYLYQMDRNAVHIDLYDQMTFYGAFSGKHLGLHMLCQAWNVTSPKEGGMDGSEVGDAYRAGKYREIAEYCLADVIATVEVYKRWQQLLQF